MKNPLVLLMALLAYATQAQPLTDIGVVKCPVYLNTIDGEKVLSGVNLTAHKYEVYDAVTFKQKWTVTAKEQAGYTLIDIVLASRYLLDTDDAIEFFAIYYNESDKSFVTYLYGQDMDQKFSDISHLSIYSLGDVYRINMYNTNGNTFIYELEGNPPMPAEEIAPATTGTYPNPASNYLTIDFDLQGANSAELVIYSLAGDVLEKATVGAAIGMVRIDVAAYAPGVYVYTIAGAVGRFVVE